MKKFNLVNEMRKMILIVLLIFVGFFHTYGQESKAALKSSPHKTIFRLSFLTPGLIVDQNLSKKINLHFKVWEGFNYYYINTNGGSSSSLEFCTYFTLEPRLHTLFSLGRMGGGNTGKFFGSYVALPITIGLNEPSYTVGPIYGFQKAFGKRGFWNLGLGFGYTNYKSEENYGLIGDFGLGITLN